MNRQRDRKESEGGRGGKQTQNTLLIPVHQNKGKRQCPLKRWSVQHCAASVSFPVFRHVKGNLGEGCVSARCCGDGSDSRGGAQALDFLGSRQCSLERPWRRRLFLNVREPVPAHFKIIFSKVICLALLSFFFKHTFFFWVLLKILKTGSEKGTDLRLGQHPAPKGRRCL